MNGKRVGLYLRVSTGDQTIENQRQALTAACEARRWRIVEEFIDNGISGAKGRDKRPGFDRLRGRKAEPNKGDPRTFQLIPEMFIMWEVKQNASIRA